MNIVQKQMIHIGTSITANMLSYNCDYFDSLQKNSEFKNFVLCCGFNPISFGLSQRYPQIQFIEVDMSKIDTKAKNGWPTNRIDFMTLQSGEFIEYLDVSEDDTIIFTDFDITIQRKLNKVELEAINHLDNETFMMQWDSFPTNNLYDYFPALAPKKGPEDWEREFGVDLRSMYSYNTGVLIAKPLAFRKLWEEFKTFDKSMIEYFSRHAAVQFIDCFIAQNKMKVQKMEDFTHNGQWFTGSKVSFQDGFMMCQGEKVLFAHHKFKLTTKF